MFFAPLACWMKEKVRTVAKMHKMEVFMVRMFVALAGTVRIGEYQSFSSSFIHIKQIVIAIILDFIPIFMILGNFV